jgi:phosphocarrier protein
MKKIKITLENETGLHARPASALVQASQKYDSDINISKDNDLYNAKSMMSILSMGASMGTVLEFQIEGADEDAAFEEINSIINNNFGE